MKLFLSGGGSREKSKMIDEMFVKSLNKDKPLLYIPIAINAVKHPYPECLKWISDTLKPIEDIKIVMWTEKELKEAKEKDFNQFGGVYIGGGNTFKLLKELKEFGTLKQIERLVQKGISVYGGSAGAIILGKNIITAKHEDPNDVELTNLDSLNLLEDYDIWPHYIPLMDEKIRDCITKNKIKIIAIPEDSGIYATKNKIEVVGPAEVFVFNKDKKVVLSPARLLIIDY